MLQWITFALALFSTALWVVVLAVGSRMYSAYRQQVKAAQSLAKAMRAARPPTPTSPFGEATD